MAKGKTKYPTKANSTYIICDDIRTEKSNKLILIGVYPGGNINFTNEISADAPSLVPALTFCFWFTDCYGKFVSTLKFFDPEGNELFQRDLGSADLEKGRTLTYVVSAQNAEFKATGTYQISVLLNDREYQFPVKVTDKSSAI